MWFKIDDGWWHNRKTRRALRSHPSKRRDAGAAGVWSLAGDWSADTGTEGFIPEDELEQWDDDWELIAKRLVDAGYWTEETRDGERGYLFHDWEGYQPLKAKIAADKAAAAERQQRWRDKHRNAAGRFQGDGEEPPLDDDRNALRERDITRESQGRVTDPVTPPRPDPTRPESTSMANLVSQLPVVEANGKNFSMPEGLLTEISDALCCDRPAALAVAGKYLAEAPGDVRSPGAYVRRSFRADPNKHKPKRPSPTKAQQCPKHPGQWADRCGPCAADLKAGTHDE